MEHLILKYLLNELTLDEQHKLSKWIQADEKNAQTLRRIYAYWHHHKTDLHDEEQEVRARLHSMIGTDQDQIRGTKSKTLAWSFRIAASIIVIFSIVLGITRYSSRSQRLDEVTSVRLVEKVSLPGQKITTTLPDGTIVKLNADSKLIVPERFEGATREVTLVGEAFFDVKRDEAHPFIIKTDQLAVRVLGTSFNVKAYYGDEKQAVAVKSGKVAVEGYNRPPVELLPNEMARSDGNILKKSSIPESALPFDWVDHHLVFSNESFDEVLKKITRWYGVRVVLDGNITIKKAYTANHDNPTLIEMMEVFSHVYNLQFKFYEKEKRITISKK